MKKVLSLALFGVLLASGAWGQEITFVWDANLEPDLAGYRLYQTAVSCQYTFDADHVVVEIPAGTETVTVDVLDGDWFWVLTAYDASGNESGPSNEVDNACPGAPKNFRHNEAT